MRHASVPEPPTLLAGRFRLLARIGRGGPCSSYVSVVLGAGFCQFCGVQLLAPMSEHLDQIPAFLGRARQAARLSHPNVASLFEVGEQDGWIFLVSEYLHGQPLHLARRPPHGDPPGPLLQAWVVSEVLGGVHCAHELGVVHGDLRPNHVYLTYDGEVKVYNFASPLPGKPRRVNRGKIAYLSPEQVRGEPIDRRSDVFALGLMLFESLRGLPLWPLVPGAIVRWSRAKMPPLGPLLPAVPTALVDIAQRALSLDPSERYPTALAMKTELDAFLRTQAPVSSEHLAYFLRQRFAAEKALDEGAMRAWRGPDPDVDPGNERLLAWPTGVTSPGPPEPPDPSLVVPALREPSEPPRAPGGWWSRWSRWLRR